MSPMTNSSARKRHENTTPKETPVPKHPETTTEWLEDIALELHAITGLLNERLPVVHPNGQSNELNNDDERAKAEPECDCGAADGYHGVDCPRAVLKPQPDPDTYDEVERLLAANRDLTSRAKKAEAERDEWKAKAERVDDAARHWMDRCHAAEEKAEAARADRDTWEAAYKRADDAYSRARDERDTALANEKASDAALADCNRDRLRLRDRYEALREDVDRERSNAPTIAETVPLTRILDRDDERGEQS